MSKKNKKRKDSALKRLCQHVREYGLGNVLAQLAPMMRCEKELPSVEAAIKVIKKAKKEGKTVAFASGCFDILHAGHVLFFADCKVGADILIVGVDSNKNVNTAKGDGHPMFDETERLLVVASQEVVNYVFLFDGPCAALLQKLKPTYYCFSPSIRSTARSRRTLKKLALRSKRRATASRPGPARASPAPSGPPIFCPASGSDG